METTDKKEFIKIIGQENFDKLEQATEEISESCPCGWESFACKEYRKSIDILGKNGNLYEIRSLKRVFYKNNEKSCTYYVFPRLSYKNLKTGEIKTWAEWGRFYTKPDGATEDPFDIALKTNLVQVYKKGEEWFEKKFYISFGCLTIISDVPEFSDIRPFDNVEKDLYELSKQLKYSAELNSVQLHNLEEHLYCNHINYYKEIY